MKPFMIYLIGTSGSGKTTIASALMEQLSCKTIQYIDGDDIREELGGLFGYTFEERMKCNKVVRTIAKYLLMNNVSVVLSQVGGYHEMRDAVRNTCGDLCEYMEVYVKCSYEECARRDVKGYYKKANEGKVKNFNGHDADFEIPSNSELVINTEQCSVDQAVSAIIQYLKGIGYEI